MATLQRTFQQLYEEVGRQMFGTDGATALAALTPTGYATTAKVISSRVVNDAYAEVLAATNWPFMSPEAQLTAFAAVSVAAAVTVTGVYADPLTTLTATGGTPFLPEMVGRTITITTIGDFVIASYTSSTVVKLTGNATCAGKTFSIPAGTCRMPATYLALIDPFTFDDDDVDSRPLDQVSLETIRRRRTFDGDVTDEPRMFAIVPTAYSTTAGDQFDIEFWPTPSTTRVLNYRYRVAATELSADADLPLGGPEMAALYLAAVKKQAEVAMNVTGGYHTRRYFGSQSEPGLLPLAIANAAEKSSGVVLGVSAQRYGDERIQEFTVNNLTDVS